MDGETAEAAPAPSSCLSPLMGFRWFFLLSRLTSLPLRWWFILPYSWCNRRDRACDGKQKFPPAPSSPPGWESVLNLRHHVDDRELELFISCRCGRNRHVWCQNCCGWKMSQSVMPKGPEQKEPQTLNPHSRFAETSRQGHGPLGVTHAPVLGSCWTTGPGHTVRPCSQPVQCPCPLTGQLSGGN